MTQSDPPDLPDVSRPDPPSMRMESDAGRLPLSQRNWMIGLVVVGVAAVLVAAAAATVVVVGSLPKLDWGSSDDGGYGLAVGDCIDDGEVENYIAGTDYVVIGCEQPHDNEVYLVHEFPPEPYPGSDTLRESLRAICESAFEAYVGRDYETSALIIYPLRPGEGLWEDGERIAECLLYDIDHNPLIGSAKNSGW